MAALVRVVGLLGSGEWSLTKDPVGGLVLVGLLGSGQCFGRSLCISTNTMLLQI